MLLTTRELFELDTRPEVERIERVHVGHGVHVLYLFHLDGLFLEEQRLVVDEQRGSVGISQKDHIVNEIPMSSVEIAVRC